MAKIRSILCCCGSGLGSSLMVQMNVEKAVKNLGIEGVEEIGHDTINGVNPNSADLFVVGNDLKQLFKDYPRVVILKAILSMDELTKKLEEAFAVEGDEIHIGFDD
jgi:PTS system ascorbate-specific IIB component